MMWHLPSKAVSPKFRAEVAKALPGLGDNLNYWRITEYLLFSTWRTQDTRDILLPRPLLALIEGKKDNSKYSASKSIEQYSRDVVKVNLIACDWDKPYTIGSVAWPRDLLIAFNKEIRITGDEDKVHFSTGKTYTRRHSDSDRKAEHDYAVAKSEAMETQSNRNNHTALDLLHYLNEAAPNRFSKIKKHLAAAHTQADALSTTLEEIIHQHKILDWIEQNAQPFYGPAPRSARVFSTNNSFLRLERSVRKIVTQDWTTCDLKSCQLAVVAKVWGIPILEDFLRSGKSIWIELMNHMQMDTSSLERYEEAKDVLKSCLYALVYGAGARRVFKVLKPYFRRSATAYRLLTSHTLIAALLEAREQQFEMIRKGHGVTDAFGNWWPIEFEPSRGYYHDHDNVRSLLSIVAQSFELRLLEPVIALAIANKDDRKHGFFLTSYLFDGITFDVADPRDREKWGRKLAEAVKTHADSLGIATELELS